ncbi:uncharacterized protein K02A2.6 [Trichonephila clavipes]|nr:uncharacterized protein K02A2.6 [Trichonephila clavipes]
MEQQIADLLRQNQDLIRALQIREDSHSHKVTVQFEKFDEENENFDCFIERFETYLDVQNVPIANRAKACFASKKANAKSVKTKNRVRTVPFALKGRVENEIDRLEKRGYHRKVDSSEWATPVVPVVKSDGSIRLASDASPVGIGCVLSTMCIQMALNVRSRSHQELYLSEKIAPCKLIKKLFQ